MSDPSGKTVAVVVVEDDADMRQAIGRLLRAARFHAMAFASAEELLEADIATSAGCLVLDINLPGINGFELQERLAQRGARPPIIFVTAYDRPAARTQAAKAGAIAFLCKPFAAEALINAVRRAFNRRESYPGAAGSRSDPQ